MEWVAILSIALANNLDNTGVGIAYGIARIRLQPLVNLWIAAITFGITASSVALGNRAAPLLPGHTASTLSATVFCGTGLWMMFPILRPQPKEGSPAAPAHPPSLRNVLKDPRQADRDRSRHIDLWEATFLAVALSLNNIGGGFSAGLVHLSAIWIALCSAAVSFLVLWLGGWAGHRLAGMRLGEHAQTVAGILLIVIGLCQLR